MEGNTFCEILKMDSPELLYLIQLNKFYLIMNE